MPHSPIRLPGAFDRISRTGDVIVMNDIRADAVDTDRDGVRGLAGVPIMANGDVVGALCVFDAEPLEIDERALDALRALGDDQINPATALPERVGSAAVADRRGTR